jgi:hypothetical protein
MKFLFLALVALLFIGCDEDVTGLVSTNPDLLVYHAGDPVLINSQFYKNCMGVVVGYQQRHMTNEPANYDVAVICRSVGGLPKIVSVKETDLILKMTE